MSLRWFHMIFILIAIIGADMVAAWALREYGLTRHADWLAMGIVILLGGIGLIVYAWWFTRKSEQAHLP